MKVTVMLSPTRESRIIFRWEGYSVSGYRLMEIVVTFIQEVGVRLDFSCGPRGAPAFEINCGSSNSGISLPGEGGDFSSSGSCMVPEEVIGRVDCTCPA